MVTVCCPLSCPTDSVLLGAIIDVVVFLLLVVITVIAGIAVLRNEKKVDQCKCGDERCGDCWGLDTRSECCRALVGWEFYSFQGFRRVSTS